MHAYQLKNAVTQYWIKKMYAVNAEVGLNKQGRLRADLVAVCMSSRIVIIETKSGVADFRNDKKWKNYLEYADAFYFAVDQETFDKIKAKIPPGIGVFVVRESVNKQGKLALKARVAKRAKTTPMNEDIRKNMLVRMVFRNAEFNRYNKKSTVVEKE